MFFGNRQNSQGQSSKKNTRKKCSTCSVQPASTMIVNIMRKVGQHLQRDFRHTPHETQEKVMKIMTEQCSIFIIFVFCRSQINECLLPIVQVDIWPNYHDQQKQQTPHAGGWFMVLSKQLSGQHDDPSLGSEAISRP